MKRILAILLSGLFLTGCGLMAQRERQEQMAAAKAAADSGFAACQERYPVGSKEYVAKTQCEGAASQNIRPFAPYPDLFDQDLANRILISERLQGGKITLAEASAAAAQSRSQLTAEEQRRNLAGRSVGAQELAAAGAYRASMPVTCTKYGSTTSCY